MSRLALAKSCFYFEILYNTSCAALLFDYFVLTFVSVKIVPQISLFSEYNLDLGYFEQNCTGPVCSLEILLKYGFALVLDYY